MGNNHSQMVNLEGNVWWGPRYPHGLEVPPCRLLISCKWRNNVYNEEIRCHNQNSHHWDVPGRPEVKRLPLPRAPFQSLVEELRSHMPYSAAPKINNSFKNSHHWSKDILLLRMWSLTTHEIFWPGICIPNLIMRKQPTNSNWGIFCKITGPHSSNISVLWRIKAESGHHFI